MEARSMRGRDPLDDSGTIAERRQRLRERLRAECIAGAENEWLRRTGRQMTAAELERLLRRYLGDI